MAAAANTVRVHTTTRDKARAIATAQRRTIPDLLAELVDREADHLIVAQHNSAISALDPPARRHYTDELTAFDPTLADGLDGI